MLAPAFNVSANRKKKLGTPWGEPATQLIGLILDPTPFWGAPQMIGLSSPAGCHRVTERPASSDCPER